MASCADCKPESPEHSRRIAPDYNACWWCRDCAKSLCRTCFLMNGHTEHRAGPWQRKELLQSCVEALEGRCSWRTKLAADEEIALKELISEVESILIGTLHRRLEELNERDRIIIAHLNKAITEMDAGAGIIRREGARSPVYHLPSPSGAPAYKLWTMCEEQPEKMEELIAEACKFVGLQYKGNMTKKQSGRRHSSSRHSIPKETDVLLNLVPLEWTADRLAKLLVGVHCNNHIEPVQEHDQVVDEPRSVTPPSRRSQGIKVNGTTTRKAQLASPDDQADHTSSETFPTPPSSNEIIYNGDVTMDSPQMTGKFRVSNDPKRQPLEPNVFVRATSLRARKHSPTTIEYASTARKSSSTIPYERVSRNSDCPSGASTIPNYHHRDNSSFDSADHSGSAGEQHQLPNGTVNASSSTDISGVSTPVKKTWMIRHFGEDYLTRPIDIVALPDRNAFAVSDSCGGIYIVTGDGGTVRPKLDVKNASASSLAVGKRDGVTVLLVSVLQSRGRSVHIYDVDNAFREVERIPCPREPKIDISRTRWLTLGPRGEIYMVSGDNSRSALWVYVERKKVWRIVHESRKTRFQYLCVAEDQKEFKAVVLLTCDAAQNRLLLFVVDTMGNLINEYDLTKTYRLNAHLVNPASAIVDAKGNLLVVDYASGKLWVLLSGVKGIRRLKELDLGVGAAQALGLTALGDYVYVACFNNRRILCVRYLQDGIFKSPSQSSLLKSPMLGRRSISATPRPHESQV